ncbi:hypothetical protein V6N13_024313 [Hibiscus sabdariffa]
MGAASSDWAGDGYGGISGVEPIGESGVEARLAGTSTGVVAGLVVVVWLETGTTGGDATGDCRGSAGTTGAEGPALSAVAAVVWIGMEGDAGIATLRGVASTTSIFRICSSAKGRDEAGKGQDAFVVCAGCCQLFGQNLSNVDAIACHYSVNEEQPRPVHGSAFFTEEVLDLFKVFFFQCSEHCIETWVIIWQAQDRVDGGCVGCNSPATISCVIFTSRVAGVELDYLVEIGSGWLSCKTELAEIVQPVIYELFKAVVDLTVIKEEYLLLPAVLGSNHSISSRESYVGHFC